MTERYAEKADSDSSSIIMDSEASEFSTIHAKERERPRALLNENNLPQGKMTFLGETNQACSADDFAS